MKLLIYCFSFRNEIQVRILRALEEDPMIQELMASQSLLIYKGIFKSKAPALIRKVESFKPTHILGLASYRKDAKLIRLEQEFINKYGTSVININMPEKLYATWNITDTDCCKKAYFAGNGPCNFVSFNLLAKEKELNLGFKFSFMHIPKLFDVEKAVFFLKKIIVTTI